MATKNIDVLDTLGIDASDNEFVKDSVVKMAADRIYTAHQEGGQADTGEIYEEAKKLDDRVDDMDLRQFHARVLLQIKRRLTAMSDNGNGKAVPKKSTTSTKKSTPKKTTASKKTTSTAATTTAKAQETSDTSDAQGSNDSERELENILFEMAHEVYNEATENNWSAIDFARYISANMDAYRDRCITVCS